MININCGLWMGFLNIERNEEICLNVLQPGLEPGFGFDEGYNGCCCEKDINLMRSVKEFNWPQFHLIEGSSHA